MNAAAIVIVQKTVGVAAPLQHALQPLAAKIRAAFVFDDLVGPGKPLKPEAPDATEFAELIGSLLTKANAMSPI